MKWIQIWKSKKDFLWIALCFPLLGCGSMLCSKGDTNQGVFFDFDPVLQSVDIGAYPTFHSKDSWVKKLIVKPEGFLLVSSQKTVHCDNHEEMKKNIHLVCKGHKLVEVYTIFRYIDKTGYQEWSYASLQEWENITDLYHKFSKKPQYHYQKCRYKFFGFLYQLWQIIKKV